MRKTELVINDIKELVNTKGYIYALCMILFEDFHVFPEKLQELDTQKRLSVKEASLLLGFLIQTEIDFFPPDTPQDLIQLKKKTYELLEDLHASFLNPFIEKMQTNSNKKCEMKNIRKEQKDFFGKGDMLIESIFYSGTGAYDFQYLDFLERKYKYDRQWLLEKKNFNIKQIKNIVDQIKNILQEKAKKICLYDLKEKFPQIIEESKKKFPDEDWEKHANEILPMIELHQYVELFFEHSQYEKELSKDKIREAGWKSFYRELIELFIIRKSDFDIHTEIDSFLNNFSITFEKNLNSQFQCIGSFNQINAKPIIKLDEERYFVPIIFLLSEAIYESPFYWMWHEDNAYRDQLAKNRGITGEEITYDFLSSVFGKNKTFKSVKIITKKGKDDTDIDVLCILGSKALCVQVKSKKLTELSRTGNDEQLQKDFQFAVQDAYKQGLVSRKKILERNARFHDESGNILKLSEEIDEVYILGITSENYPSLTHQAHFMLEKKEDEPFPIFSTIFDLELISHYLKDPYDFLYYIRQRTSLMDYFIADEETILLGYHLDTKLWKDPKLDKIVINTDFGQLIVRNYYPLKAGLVVSDQGDAIKSRWKNNDFDRLCNQLKSLSEAKITDIIFHLLDFSGEARKSLVNFIVKTKQQTLKDGELHNFSIPPDDSYTCCVRLGVTYVSLNSNTTEELRNKLLTLCQVRKYKSKGDAWIGFGSLMNSSEMIDVVVYNDQKWEYDKELEKMSKIMLEGPGQGRQIFIGNR